MIHHWESYFGVLDLAHGGTRTVELHAAKSPNGMLDATGPAKGVAKEPAVTAQVSGSCWVALCPKEGCGGCEFVHFGDLRFFCCGCRNVDWDHQPLPVKVPGDKQRAVLERALLKRPDARTRNWEPHESIADLEAENALHGVNDEEAT